MITAFKISIREKKVNKYTNSKWEFLCCCLFFSRLFCLFVLLQWTARLFTSRIIGTSLLRWFWRSEMMLWISEQRCAAICGRMMIDLFADGLCRFSLMASHLFKSSPTHCALEILHSFSFTFFLYVVYVKREREKEKNISVTIAN